MRLIFLSSLIITAFMSAPLSAQTIKLARITSISDTYILTDGNGIDYILAALRFPAKNIANNKKTFQLLAELLLGKEVTIQIPDNASDRYGRLHVNIYDEKNIWINGQLIEQGLAILSGAPIAANKLKQLQALESHAEKNKLGHWRRGYFKTYSAHLYEGPLYEFAIIEGTVLQVKGVKQNIYLNFEDDWRQDFSIGIAKPLGKDFKSSGINLPDLEGKRIRVRGWVRKYNGPFLEILQVTQLQLL